MDHGEIVQSWCVYSDRHNGETPPCAANCHIDCADHLLMFADGYSCMGDEIDEVLT